jgi:DNA repair exonuclease SbcCD ATPase subunit
MSMQRDAQLATVRTGLARISDRFGYQQQHVAALYKRMELLEQEKADIVKAVGLIDRAIQTISANGIGRIEGIVTWGLRMVFQNDTYGLRIVKKEGQRGNTYELEPYCGEVHGKASDTFGGGLSDVISLLLRVMMIERFGLARYLFVDEAFKQLSAEYLPNLSELLQALCTKRGYTIFAITHQKALACAADNVYRLVPQKDAPPVLHRLDQNALDFLKQVAEAVATGE